MFIEIIFPNKEFLFCDASYSFEKPILKRILLSKAMMSGLKDISEIFIWQLHCLKLHLETISYDTLNCIPKCLFAVSLLMYDYVRVRNFNKNIF